MVRRSTPESWIVICPECQRHKQRTPPLGINLPVSSRQIAEMLAKSHAKRRGGLGTEARWLAPPPAELPEPCETLEMVGAGPDEEPAIALTER